MSGVKGSRFKGRKGASLTKPGSGAPFTSHKGTVPNPGTAFVPPDAQSRTRKGPYR